MKYYSIRVVEALDLDEAIERVGDNHFVESHPLCDKVFTYFELLKNLLSLKIKKSIVWKT